MGIQRVPGGAWVVRGVARDAFLLTTYIRTDLSLTLDNPHHAFTQTCLALSGSALRVTIMHTWLGLGLIKVRPNPDPDSNPPPDPLL